ncbi:hypothetical protein B0H15DRAFT_800952 [Mycena belliarum]|uniref:BTB domain-containing protein n=1 Tax=Mycena belliarum TaxID=1033014 RepID=A0AAD6U668_9AGAR|nr:hypothetical protein B0H15DRAFT_800952 [Mycena belliae]
MSRHPTLYFADGTLTLKASDGTLYNVYQHHLIMQSDFFSGMLTLPIPNHPPISLTDNTKDWIQKARDAGLDGTSDATAVQLPDKFTNIDCERFLEFVFNTKGWTARVPDLDVLCSILKTSHFFAAESGVEYAIHHLENHEGLAAALRFKMGCDYHLTEWITQAFDELMSTSIKDMTAEDEQLIGQRAYRAIARAQAAVQDHRVTLAVCPPPPSHTNWCSGSMSNRKFCTDEWEAGWTSVSGVLGALIKAELPGSEIHDSLHAFSFGAMPFECRERTCTSLKDTADRRSVLKKEEDIIDAEVEALMKELL